MTVTTKGNRLLNALIAFMFLVCIALSLVHYRKPDSNGHLLKTSKFPNIRGGQSASKVSNKIESGKAKSRNAGNISDTSNIGNLTNEDMAMAFNEASLMSMRGTSKQWIREAMRDDAFRRAAVSEMAKFIDPYYLDLYKMLRLDDASSELFRELLSERFIGFLATLNGWRGSQGWRRGSRAWR